jgi:hypothetical protein
MARAARNPYTSPAPVRQSRRSVEEKYGRYATYTPRRSLFERLFGQIFGQRQGTQRSWVDDLRKQAREKPRRPSTPRRYYGLK